MLKYLVYLLLLNFPVIDVLDCLNVPLILRQTTQRSEERPIRSWTWRLILRDNWCLIQLEAQVLFFAMASAVYLKIQILKHWFSDASRLIVHIDLVFEQDSLTYHGRWIQGILIRPRTRTRDRVYALSPQCDDLFLGNIWRSFPVAPIRIWDHCHLGLSVIIMRLQIGCHLSSGQGLRVCYLMETCSSMWNWRSSLLRFLTLCFWSDSMLMLHFVLISGSLVLATRSILGVWRFYRSCLNLLMSIKESLGLCSFLVDH